MPFIKRLARTNLGARCVLLLILCFTTLSIQAQQDGRPTQSAVAMPDAFSAEVAAKILAEGGNAVDAAIAAAFSLAVTFPEAGNIGGGGFMLIYKHGQADFLDYRESAPLHASRDMYLDAAGEVVSERSKWGALAAGTPGTVSGLWLAHQKYASLSWARLLQPAIDLAIEGFEPSAKQQDKYAGYLPWLSTKSPSAAAYIRALQNTDGKFKQPDLGASLQRIAAQGADGFYQGSTAELIVEQMQRSGGLIDHEDLQSYSALWRAPLRGQWLGYEVLSAPPPSSGGIALLQLLKMKQALAPEFAKHQHNSAIYIHLLAEMEKRVYADRAEYLGDPDFVSVPQAQLLADDYIHRRAQEVNPQAISATPAISAGLHESEQTTHFSIIDRWGSAVSNTYTLNLPFGSGVFVEGAGFFLNDQMDDFSAKPGVANSFGVVGGRANEIAPGKRMLSSMSPTIVLEQGEAIVAVGTPGGSTIITSVMQSLLNLLDYKQSPELAVNNLRLHHQLLPKDKIIHSLALDKDTAQQLQDLGYNLQLRRLGDLQLVSRDSQGLHAVSDSRGRGKALVIEH